ncbi:MAG: cupin domain-containing protein [Planctomycetes bacterium]|nr:cupin domain-containing protein [Planctomycetota bacterium]
MAESEPSPIFRRGAGLTPVPARRPGFRERRILTREDSPHQNVIHVEADEGAEVEMHPVPNSESLYVLDGVIDFTAPGFAQRLGPGDLVHFQPGAQHGMKVVLGPARYLVIFAPGR